MLTKVETAGCCAVPVVADAAAPLALNIVDLAQVECCGRMAAGSSSSSHLA